MLSPVMSSQSRVYQDVVLMHSTGNLEPLMNMKPEIYICALNWYYNQVIEIQTLVTNGQIISQTKVLNPLPVNALDNAIDEYGAFSEIEQFYTTRNNEIDEQLALFMQDMMRDALYIIAENYIPFDAQTIIPDRAIYKLNYVRMADYHTLALHVTTIDLMAVPYRNRGQHDHRHILTEDALGAHTHTINPQGVDLNDIQPTGHFHRVLGASNGPARARRE